MLFPPGRCADYLAPQKRERMRLELGLSPLDQHRLPSDNSPSRADLVMRGFAISFLTLASAASPGFLLVFFFVQHPQ